MQILGKGFFTCKADNSVVTHVNPNPYARVTVNVIY